jgi:hypothetical protein
VPVRGRVRWEANGRARSLAVVLGGTAALGRGGPDAVPPVDWWLHAEPFGSADNRSLSRRHAVLELRDGRAWLTDQSSNQSSNGTWLNERRLPGKTAELLHDGDRVGLKALALAVRLFGDGRSVHAALLERADGLRGLAGYLLTDGRRPVADGEPGGPPATWLAWRRDAAGVSLGARPAGGGDWLWLPPGGSATAGAIGVTWRVLERPEDQATLVAGP